MTSVARVDYGALYKNACATAACRVNSAVLKMLSEAPRTPLTRLLLHNNYVGSKGLGPILCLIENCQTIEVIDLRGNGLDNDSIRRLCEVLEKHLGVHSLLLSDNPITHDGGRYIMHLLETNPRITELELERTDVFESLVERIRQAAEENRRAAPPTLQSVMKDTSRATPSPTSASSTVGTSTPVAHRPNSRTGRMTGATVRERGPKDMPSSPSGVKVPLSQGSVLAPRPPPPAIASAEFSRLTEPQREDIKTKYMQRQGVFSSVAASEASRAATSARYQLMMLEAADRRMQAQTGSGGDSSPHRSQHNTIENENTCESPSSEATGLSFTQQQQQLHGEGTSASTVTKTHRVKRASICEDNIRDKDRYEGEELEKDKDSVPQEPTPTSDIAGEAASNTNDEEKEKEKEKQQQIHTQEVCAAATPPTPIQLGADGRTIVYSKDPTVAPFVVPYTKEEAFKALFEAGCAAYKEKNLDGAYLKWNEAMTFAAEHKNREWIAIVTNNLQRLSYELLVAEGTKHMEASRLDEADRSYSFAMEVAKKAKNAAWESDMLKAKKNVQHAVFHRTCEQATQLFDQAKKAVYEVITDEDQFVSPDGMGLVHHTTAYFNEWQRMLLIKEAMEGWVDANAVAKRITGPSSRVLQDIVTSSVLNVSQYLLRQYYSERLNLEDSVLPQQGTSRFTYDEAKNLHVLWVDLVGRTNTLNSSLFNAVAYGQIGHLSLALNQVAPAIQYFDAMVAIGEELHDPIVLGCGLTYLGRAHWQRSNFGVAEKCLRKALDKWAAFQSYSKKERSGKADEELPPIELKSMPLPNSQALQKGPLVLAPSEYSPAGTPSKQGASGNSATEHGTITTTDNSPITHTVGTNASVGMGASVFYRCVPHEVLTALQSISFSTLVNILVSIHRHHDALEMLELSLHTKYNDDLADKIVLNFTETPTMDHIIAVAASLRTPLVYMDTSTRFDWNEDEDKYATEQQLHLWIVPPEGEMKFVTVEVTKEHHVPSVMSLVNQVRDSLYVAPIGTNGAGAEGIIDKLPEDTWRTPLQTLFDIIVDPMLGYLSAHAGYSDEAILTLIPVGQLWGVPFSALLDKRDDKFFIEKFCLQLAYGAVHCTYAALNTLQSTEHNPKKNIIVVNVDGDDVEPVTLHKYDLNFPFDRQRSMVEGERIRDIIVHGQENAQRVIEEQPPLRGALRIPKSVDSQVQTTKSGEVENTSGVHVTQNLIISDLSVLKEALPMTRYCHITAPVSATASCRGFRGAICLSSTYGEIAALYSNEVAELEIFAQVVSLSNTNISLKHLSGPREGVMGMIRAFMAAGCPAVLASLWCTPDMSPYRLFELFYELYLEPQPVPVSQLILPPPPSESLVKTSETLSPRASRKAGQPITVARFKPRNKALALALATRELLKDQAYRYAPRHWAPYFMVGIGD